MEVDSWWWIGKAFLWSTEVTELMRHLNDEEEKVVGGGWNGLVVGSWELVVGGVNWVN